MALAQLGSRALLGLDAPAVQVEAHLAAGLPSFSIVGLPEAEVREARDRVRSALVNSGFDFPSARRIVVNLAPADLPKDSGRFDLPIAIALLAACGVVPRAALEAHEFAGELSLSGALRPVRGALALAWALARSDAPRRLVLPMASAREAALVAPDGVLGADDLTAVVSHLCGGAALAPPTPPAACAPEPGPDLADVRGQAQARRALEVAAAGGHHLLLVGPPGSGKTMLAQRLPGLLPPLAPDAAAEAAALASVAGRFDASLWGRRPLRSPHHTASAAAMLGGGADARPGEIALAHAGVLFLDELPEFDRRSLEGLREPLETGCIHVARAARRTTYPAAFQLVAAMNPCPCGHLGDPARPCSCTPQQVARYRGRLSGPLLDRLDLRVEVPAVSAAELLELPPGEASAAVAERVAAARQRQLARQGCVNAALHGDAFDHHCGLARATRAWLADALSRLGASARAAHRVLRVARTIADLEPAATIAPAHLAQALQLRRALDAARTPAP